MCREEIINNQIIRGSEEKFGQKSVTFVRTLKFDYKGIQF